MLIMGRSGEGKSHLVKRAIHRGDLGKRVLVVDVCDEYGEGVSGDSWTAQEPSKPITIDAAISGLRSNPPEFFWRFALHPGSPDVDDVFYLAMAAGDVTIIAEEWGLYKHSTGLETALLRGRRRGVQVISMTQRPYTVSRTVSSQCVAGAVFATDEPRDIAYIRERWGQEQAAELDTLQPGNYEFVVLGDAQLFCGFFHQ